MDALPPPRSSAQHPHSPSHSQLTEVSLQEKPWTFSRPSSPLPWAQGERQDAGCQLMTHSLGNWAWCGFLRKEPMSKGFFLFFPPHFFLPSLFFFLTFFPPRFFILSSIFLFYFSRGIGQCRADYREERHCKGPSASPLLRSLRV